MSGKDEKKIVFKELPDLSREPYTPIDTRKRYQNLDLIPKE